MAAFGLYTHIQANRRRSAILIAGLFLLVYVVVFGMALIFEAVTGRGTLEVYLYRARNDLLAAMPLVTIAMLMWLFIGYRFHQALIDSVTDAREVTRAENPRLYNLLENLCISRGVPVPAVRIMETDVLNAYASGLNESQYSVAVTRGLLDALDDQELEGVLAHELTHIRNGDVRLMVIATIIAGVVSFAGELLFRWFMNGPRIRLDSGSSDEKGSRANPAMAAILFGIVLILVAWLLSVVLKFALSRSREYLADAGAVELTKNPDAMISALMKISGRAEIPGVPSGIMEMCIENEKSGFADLFATHPPIEERIQSLVTNAGGRLPPPEPERPAQLPSFTQPQQAGPWAGQAPGGLPLPLPLPGGNFPGGAGPWGR